MVWRLVDCVWERKKSRDEYEWLYLKNPLGFARSNLVFEKQSGELVSTKARFPWPVACGRQRLTGVFGGDAVTLQRLQRTGLTPLRRGPDKVHPHDPSLIVLSAPNAKSRANGRKQGDEPPLGPLPTSSLILDFQSFLGRRSFPRTFARAAGAVSNHALGHWHRQVLEVDPDLSIVDIGRFEAGIDSVTWQHMKNDSYWCPHEADFLNWRYLDHPGFEYVAIGLERKGDLVAYAVVRLSGDFSHLMEFSADEGRTAHMLLRAVIDTARKAGCDVVRFYATTGWHHWKLFRRAGFYHRPSDSYISAKCESRDDVSLERNWQLLPGDSDVT